MIRVEFVERQFGPERLVCEAELVFEGEEFGPVQGMKLVGFCLWRGADGEVYVTFPSRAIGVGQERRFFDYLRSVAGTVDGPRAVKAYIMAEWQKKQQAESVPDDVARAHGLK